MAVGPLLSLEDHFVSSTCQQDDVAQTLQLHQFPPRILQRLVDVDSQRLEVMDEGNVRLQVVSLIPVCVGIKECRQTNDEIRKAVQKHPGRFAGFAALPMATPEEIAAELERCVKELGFVGALVPNHANGTYYDGPEYLPMWQAAERLDVPIYLHPCPPSSGMVPHFAGNYSDDVSFAISTHAWDWHANCGVHLIRLYASGLFDKCSKLKLILGHLGEMVPFMLGRIERKLALTRDAKSWKASFIQVYARNIWVTTSGMFDMESLKLVLATTKIERIMFSIDYPFESTIQSRDFMEQFQKSKLVSEDDFARIAYKNAEELLGVKISDQKGEL